MPICQLVTLLHKRLVIGEEGTTALTCTFVERATAVVASATLATSANGFRSLTAVWTCGDVTNK